MAENPKDLEERTAVFAEDVTSFVRRLPEALELKLIFASIIKKLE